MRPDRVLAGTLAALISLGVSGAQPGPLDLFTWEKRLILIFADQPADPWAYQQRLDLLENRCGFDDRDLLLLEVFADRPVLATGRGFEGEPLDEQPLTGIENSDLRRFYAVEQGFGLLLIGKDGGEKRRSLLPDDVEQIFDQIDAMPMRQQEIMAEDGC